MYIIVKWYSMWIWGKKKEMKSEYVSKEIKIKKCKDNEKIIYTVLV